MNPESDYKILVRKFGALLFDEDIFYRIYGTQKPRPYHKLKTISAITYSSRIIRCRFGTNRNLRSLARLILQPKKGMFADHIDRNVLDNRRSNLRAVNIRQNNLNRRGTSCTGFFGVTLKRKRKHCVGYFRTGKKTLWFEAKDSEANRILCALAHDKFVLQCGDEEYAPLNFPCWKFEPFKSILLKENLYAHKERV